VVVIVNRRAVIVGSALFIAFIQVVGSFGAAHGQPERRDLDAVAVVLLLAGPLALAVRDRWPLLGAAGPLAACVVYLARGYPYGPIFLSVIVGLVTAVLAGERRSTWIVAAAGLVAYPIVAWALDGPQPSVAHVAAVGGWLVVILAVADLARARRFEVAERTRRRSSDERLRIARDLHDVLAHNISLINVQAGVALHLMDEQPEQARTALAHIKSASRDALQELRSALDVLRYGDERAARAPAPGLADLGGLVDAVRAGGLDVRTDISPTLAQLPKPVDLAAYRIVQEALTNVRRHSGARHATVRIRDGERLTIEVLDDGRGGAAGEGNGIVGMRERASALGGTLAAGPRANGGFAVTASLPLPVRTP
jgi:signal transduction histidine kinase